MSGAHVATGVKHYPDKGYVAWCSCGVGSPLKPTKAHAIDSLASHIVSPEELPK